MRTLADFKRELTIGSEWEAIWYPTQQDKERGAPNVHLGIREVAKVGSTSVKWSIAGKETLSTMDFPKADSFQVLEGDVAAIYRSHDDKSVILTYKKVK